MLYTNTVVCVLAAVALACADPRTMGHTFAESNFKIVTIFSGFVP